MFEEVKPLRARRRDRLAGSVQRTRRAQIRFARARRTACAISSAARSHGNPRLVNYLAAGGVHGLRPLRYEKRVARNRFIALVIILFVILLGVFSIFLQTIESERMNVKNNFVELPISTRDGQFIAHYSEKGLAELNFPPVGRASLASRRKQMEFQPKSAPGIAPRKPR